MLKNDIEKLVEETIHSFDGAKRAEAKPFLLTRIFARLQSAEESNFWIRAGSYLSRPIVAFAGLVLIIAANITIIVNSRPNVNNAVNTQSVSSAKDEFAMNGITIYDFENQEP